MPPGCHCLSGEDGLCSVIFPQLDLEGALLTPVLQPPSVPGSLLCALTVFPQEEEHISLPKLWPRDSLRPVN